MKNLFKIPDNITFFYIKNCNCNNIVLYIDPRLIDKGEKYIYIIGRESYIHFCFDVLGQCVIFTN